MHSISYEVSPKDMELLTGRVEGGEGQVVQGISNRNIRKKKRTKGLYT